MTNLTRMLQNTQTYKWDGMDGMDGYLWMGPSIEHLTVLIKNNKNVDKYLFSNVNVLFLLFVLLNVPQYT